MKLRGIRFGLQRSTGRSMLRGCFDTTPSRLSYALDYAVSEGEWKLIGIDVNVRGSSTVDAGSADLLMHAAADLSGGAR
jgi:hypothetical protein